MLQDFVTDIFGERLLGWMRNELHCPSLKLSLLLSEYSTGPVLLMLAVERLIVVVFPFKANTILTNKFFLVTSAIIVVCGTLLTFVGAIGFFQEFNSCSLEG